MKEGEDDLRSSPSKRAPPELSTDSALAEEPLSKTQRFTIHTPAPSPPTSPPMSQGHKREGESGVSASSEAVSPTKTQRLSAVLLSSSIPSRPLPAPLSLFLPHLLLLTVQLTHKAVQQTLLLLQLFMFQLFNVLKFLPADSHCQPPLSSCTSLLVRSLARANKQPSSS